MSTSSYNSNLLYLHDINKQNTKLRVYSYSYFFAVNPGEFSALLKLKLNEVE